MLSGRMHTTNGKLPPKKKDAMNEKSLKLHFHEMEKTEKESLKKFRNMRKTMVKDNEIQRTDVSSNDTSSDSKVDNENTETDDAGVKSWTTDGVIAFLTRLRPRKVYVSESGFKVMSKTIGK